MPDINWKQFEELPGAADRNFELLCRALTKTHYAQFGTFSERAMQPGVEFHLKLDRSCALGPAGRWFGWQCRWYDLPKGTAIGSMRKEKIEKAIETTRKHLPGITDWVLWTRYTLTKADQQWFNGLKTNMKLHQWSGLDVESHLTGAGEIFRQTYFGDLVLTPMALKGAWEASVAPIRSRWIPDVHQISPAEDKLTEMLGSTAIWKELDSLRSELERYLTRIHELRGTIPSAVSESMAKFAAFGQSSLHALNELTQHGGTGDLELAKHLLETSTVPVTREIARLPSTLRSFNLEAALYVTNAVAILIDLSSLFKQILISLQTTLAVVVAEAGCGKTYLAAELTAPTSSRPAGVLLHGRDLPWNGTINDVAKAVVISGAPCASFEALAAALDVAGKRSRTRLPIVIDALNEAEDPRAWQSILATASCVLPRYPYVLLVCTIRGAFVDEAVPPGVRRLEMEGFGRLTDKAISSYFSHYLIRQGDADLPVDLLQHPLTLRIFCEVVNPGRNRHVLLSVTPFSLTGLFETYVEQTTARVAQLSKTSHRYYAQDVRSALDKIGIALWEKRDRSMSLGDLKLLLNEGALTWDKSLIRLLEQEGVILKFPERPKEDVDPSYVNVLYAFAYDALAGHVIAGAILTLEGGKGFHTWLKRTKTASGLFGKHEKRHPLADDIFGSLVALLPRRLHRQQLWELLDGVPQATALRRAMEIDGDYLDAKTVQEIHRLILDEVKTGQVSFLRLFRTRRLVNHPLNADFLSRTLRKMSLAERDYSWSEWLRRNSSGIVADCKRAQERWRTSLSPRDSEDYLMARWFSWCLTSTCHEIRDSATRALYWFGWGSPGVLFQMTRNSLPINDPYVHERMLAACYGVCMGLHARPKRALFRSQLLPRLAREIYQAFFAPDARFRTTHAVTRDYARRIIDLASRHVDVLSQEELSLASPPFTSSSSIEWKELEDPNNGQYRDGNAPLGTDFENYTIGRLIPGRRNYDYENPDYKAVVRKIVWRIYDLGYTLERFGKVDAKIASTTEHWRDKPSSDRYGKKYARIAYQEQYGAKEDSGLLEESWRNDLLKPAECDIDPSFPDPPIRLKILPDMLASRTESAASWVDNSSVDLMPYQIFHDNAREWVMLDGYCSQEDKKSGRMFFVRFQTFMILRSDQDRFLELLAKQKARGRWMPDTTTDNYTFAGEIAWCETFRDSEFPMVDFIAGRQRRRIPKSGHQMFLHLLDQLRDKSRPTPKFETVDTLESIAAFVPAREISFLGESRAENVSGSVPAKEIMEFFGLNLMLPGWRTADAEGLIHSFASREYRPQVSERYLFFRRDKLDQLLFEQQLSLVFVAWGERQRIGSRLAPVPGGQQWKYFQQSRLYNTGNVDPE